MTAANRHFVRHYVEMLVAMVLGMVVEYSGGAHGHGEVQRVAA